MKRSLASVSIAALLLASPVFTNAETTTCPVLTRVLGRGAAGADVKQLQQFLVSRNLLTPDSATGYFGPLTEKALQSFQKAQSVAVSGTPSTTGYGLAGAKTRTAIAVLCSKPVSSALKEHVVPKLRNTLCPAVQLPIDKTCTGTWREVKASTGTGCTASWECAK